MGTSGAALATLLSQAVNFLMMFVLFHKYQAILARPAGDPSSVTVAPETVIRRQYAVIAPPFKIQNMILGGGIVRSGGKTRYIMIIDLIGTWGFGVPLGLLSAFVFRLPIDALPIYHGRRFPPQELDAETITQRNMIYITR